MFIPAFEDLGNSTGNVIMQGQITATAGGTIGGFEIGNTYLQKGTSFRFSSSVDTNDPASFISSSNFKVGVDGRVTASSANIGGWHIDANRENKPIDMKLTCLLNLSEEPYEGGEFKLIGVDKKIKFDSGEGLVFTSLQAHKVTPVTKGKRITLTYWGYGPSWR